MDLLRHHAKRALFALLFFFVCVLGFNDTSTLVGHLVSSSREREKRDRRDSRDESKRTEEKVENE